MNITVKVISLFILLYRIFFFILFQAKSTSRTGTNRSNAIIDAKTPKIDINQDSNFALESAGNNIGKKNKNCQL